MSNLCLCGKVLKRSKTKQCRNCFLESVRKKTPICLDCPKIISKNATRCGSCSQLYVRKNIVHPSYIDGRSIKPKFCKCGKKLSKYIYNKCHSCSAKEFTNKPEFKEQCRIRFLGTKNPMYGKHHSIETIQKIVSKTRRNIKSPNNLEKKFIKLLKSLNLEKYEFVGNGRYFVKNYNPDFVCKKDKKIIELYGDYWHRKEKNIEPISMERIKCYSKNNYDSLVIWESELNSNIDDVIKSIKLLEELPSYAQ